MKPLISIIIPVYNVEKYLERCVKSLLKQTLSDVEIILINDGSTDHSLEICEELSTQDKRIKVISQSNQGPSEARNVGLRHASAPYVVGVDSDDWVRPNYLELLYSLALRYDADIIIAETLYEHDGHVTENKYNDGSITVMDQQQALSALLINKFIRDHFWGKLYRRELLEKHPFKKGKYFEDIYLMYRLFSNAGKIVKVNTTTYCYVIHQDAITAFSKDSIAKLKDWVEASLEQYEFLRANPDKFIDIGQVKASFAKRFHHIKKVMVRHVSIETPETINLRNMINEGLRITLSETTVRDLGLGRYIHYHLILKYPALFYEARRRR